jgi:radical SAM protein with 4Fe4S-binding SPASM domain
MDPSLTRTSDLNHAINRAIEDSVDYNGVFLDNVSDIVDLDGKLHCKFYHGMVAVGANGEVRPCLESPKFFRKVAPWSVDTRKAWELDNIEAHSAFTTISMINEEHKPNQDTCGACQLLRYCEGCLLAGFTCYERR